MHKSYKLDDHVFVVEISNDSTDMRDIHEIFEEGLGTACTDFIVDLKNLKTINTRLLAYLVTFYVKLRNKSGNMKLINLHREIMKILQITKLVNIFDIYDSVDEARLSFKKHE